jgi:putative selenate reductase
MARSMRPLSFHDLVTRAFAEYRAKGSIFDVPAEHFSGAGPLPLGVAAGPHTQLAQNILASWLAGARVIELKTVQSRDELEIAKPCIDAADAGYNTEWSTELSIEQAWDEYLKGWFLLHVFEMLLGNGHVPSASVAGAPHPARHPGASFQFVMSVGYDLAGITSERMDRFIGRLADCSREELFRRYLEETAALAARPGLFAGTPWRDRAHELSGLRDRLSGRVCRTVTLSTMHGCPPAEIERITEHLLAARGLDTVVKLNPTLLGFDRVREILDRLGWDAVELDPEGFRHDLQWEDAVPMLERLLALAEQHGRLLGVKLTNTLACRNNRSALPGPEMYLSGRALYPVTMRLAAELCGHFGDRLPMSVSAGVSAWNLADVLGCGFRPATIVTDLLKPGGYGRLKQLAEIAAPWEGAPARGRMEADRVRQAADAALEAPWSRRAFRGEDRAGVPGPLPLFDCFVAPCVEACPFGQDVPEYIHLAGAGRFEEAFAIVYNRNPLPFTTAYLCDHRCNIPCARRDWEGTVRIRELKRVAAERGFGAFRAAGSHRARQAAPRGIKAAVIGAGPAGLAAASFLGREGFETHVFERAREPGGMVRYGLPGFRVPAEMLERDVGLLRDLGVTLHLEAAGTPTVAELQSRNFRYVVVAVGAGVERDIGIPGATPAIGFLRGFREDPQAARLGRSVVVVGAGDTAMDAARAALRCQGVADVRVVYRRTEREMPASAEEYEAARAEGIVFSFLRDPVSWTEGTLTCRLMALGAPDASGRAAPRPTGETERFPADAVIAAVGAAVDERALAALGVTPGRPDPKTQQTGTPGVYLVGDAASGPETIAKAIASARRAADAICAREGGGLFRPRALPRLDIRRLRGRRDRIIPSLAPDADDDAIRQTEYHRCLGCRSLCLKCVEVCPNRANTFVRVPGPFRDEVQVIHLDGLCNECGNCATFCPWDGKPYRDKLTLFASRADLEASESTGFCIDGGKLVVRSGGVVQDVEWATGRAILADTVEPALRAVIEVILHDHPYLLGVIS